MKLKFIILMTLLFNLSQLTTAQHKIESPAGKIASEPIFNHKDSLQLDLDFQTLYIDKDEMKLDKKFMLKINFETDYLVINDTLFMKIFISRNKEFGELFYQWKINYFIKEAYQFRKIGTDSYFNLQYGIKEADCSIGLFDNSNSKYYMLRFNYYLR